MTLPDLLSYSTEDEYNQHYIDHFCNDDTITTFDGITVRFFPEAFSHAFYKRSEKSWKAEKDIFSFERGMRMDWIKAVLKDPSIVPKKGYDKSKNSYDNTRRVTFISSENYVVVVSINPKRIAKFITAYLVDNERVIMNSPC